MKRILCIWALVCSAGFAQTASFPSSVVTDAQLKVAGNFIRTTLRSSMSASDTVITVASSAGIAANMLLTIDREIISVSSVSGNSLTVVRGFDGTTAAAHSSNRDVVSYPVAWDKNALSAEVKAIELALGAALSNLPVNSGSVLSTSYNWSPQSPGTALTGGAISVVTFTPCPTVMPAIGQGLYISNGVGTAEGVTRTGGTCTSGAPSGTVIFTPTYSHSGTYTIGPASCGIQEALNVAAGNVIVPAGTICTIQHPIVHTRSSVSLVAPGHQNVQLVQGRANMDILQIGDGTNLITAVGVHGFVFVGLFGTPSSSGYAVNVRNAGVIRLDGIRVYGNDAIYRGVNFQSCITCELYDSSVEHTVNDGVYIVGTAGRGSSDIKISRTLLNGNGRNGITPADYSSGIYILTNEFYQMQNGYAVSTADRTGASSECCLWIENNDIDTSSANCTVACDMGALNLYRTNLTCVSGNSMGGTSSSAKPVVWIQSTASATTVQGGVINAFGQLGIQDDVGATISGITFDAGSTGTNIIHIGATSTASHVVANNLKNTSFAGIVLFAGHQNAFIDGNSFRNATIIISGTPHITDLIGTNFGGSNAIPQIASAATITLSPEANTFTLTGNTQVTTINGAWYGRRVRMQFLGASPGGVGTGGNIYAARTATQNQVIDCTYFGTAWLCTAAY